MATIPWGAYRHVTPPIGPGGPASSSNAVGDLPQALQGWMDRMTTEDRALSTLRVRAIQPKEPKEAVGFYESRDWRCSASEEHVTC